MNFLFFFSFFLLWQPAADPLTDARKALAEFDLPTAESLAAKAVAGAPDSAAAHTLLGEVRFHEGLLTPAEIELKKAIALDPKYARAWYELSHVYDLASMHHTAELQLVKACDLAPQNKTYKEALARMRWQREHPEEAHLESPYVHASIPMGILRANRDTIRAFTLRVSINGGKPLDLKLDTGASGLLLRTKAAEKAGLQKIRESTIGGVGDKGMRDVWTTKADRLQIGSVTFTNYPLEVTDKTAFEEEDGLIGSDVFADFLVTLDFFQHKFVLDPLPGGMPDHSRSLDRILSPELSGFSPVFRLRHTLLIPTKINDAAPALFVIDSGSTTSLIAKRLAKTATKVHSDAGTTVKGLNGKVKEVSRADELTIQFANFKQRNDDMITFDLDNISRGHGVEIGGLLGLPLLGLFRSVTIDYRDGLVKFDYKGF